MGLGLGEAKPSSWPCGLGRGRWKVLQCGDGGKQGVVLGDEWGQAEGGHVGDTLGDALGVVLGDAVAPFDVGDEDGDALGDELGHDVEGEALGEAVGGTLGCGVGDHDGDAEGEADGERGASTSQLAPSGRPRRRNVRLVAAPRSRPGLLDLLSVGVPLGRRRRRRQRAGQPRHARCHLVHGGGDIAR